MITTFFIYLISYVFGLIALLLPTWTVWPQVLIDGLEYITAAFARLNFILPIQDSGGWFDAFIFLIHFSALYMSAKVLLKVVGFFRGTGSGLDLK